MAIAFPSNPSVGARHTEGDRVWEWDGVKWLSALAASGGPVPTFVAGDKNKILAVDSAGTGIGWVPIAQVSELKAPVANKAALPATGNTGGDIRITLDDGHMHAWIADATTPANSKWDDIGPTAVTASTDVPMWTATPAADYNPANTYNAGDLAVHNGMTWMAVKSLAAGVAPAAATPANWIPITGESLMKYIGSTVPRNSGNLQRFNAATAYPMGKVILGSDGHAWAAMKPIAAGGQEPGLPRWAQGWMLASGEDILYYLTRNMARDDIDDATIRGAFHSAGVSQSLLAGPFDPTKNYSDRDVVTHGSVTFVCVDGYSPGDPAPMWTARDGSHHPWYPINALEASLLTSGLTGGTKGIEPWTSGLPYADRLITWHKGSLWFNGTGGQIAAGKEPGVAPEWTKATIETMLGGGAALPATAAADHGKALAVKQDGSGYELSKWRYTDRDIDETIPTYDATKAYSRGEFIYVNDILWFAPTAIPAGAGAPKNGRYRAWIPVSGYDLAKLLYPLAPSLQWWLALLEDPTAGQLGIPEVWSATMHYSPGHVVIQSNKLWHANTASTNVPPGPGKPEWTYISVIDMAQKLQSAGPPVHVGTTAPATPKEGFLWYKTDASKMYVMVGTNWVEA